MKCEFKYIELYLCYKTCVLNMPNTLNCLTMRIKSIYCSAVYMEMIETIEYKKKYCRSH